MESIDVHVHVIPPLFVDAVHFKDKTIRVKGKVIIKEKRPRIEVDDPKQIQIVEKDKK